MEWTQEFIDSAKIFVLRKERISSSIYRSVKPYIGDRSLAELKFIQAAMQHYNGEPFEDTFEFIDAIIDGWEILEATLHRNKQTTKSICALWPAWRLNFYNQEKRKISNSEWKSRWASAGNACNWIGASKTKFIALRNSPIWKFLGDGAGWYFDTYGLPHPPFVVGNNTDWIEATETDCNRAGLAIHKVPRHLTRGELDILAAVRKYGMPKF